MIGSERICVLVVDNDPTTVEILKTRLEAQGYDVQGTDNALDALRLLEQRDYAVLTTGSSCRKSGTSPFPQIDGVELLRRVRNRHPHTAAIMITAEHSVDLAAEAMKQGAYHFMTKPFDGKELLSVVENAVQDREAAIKMLQCPKCGKRMESEWRFCPYDGTEIVQRD